MKIHFLGFACCYIHFYFYWYFYFNMVLLILIWEDFLFSVCYYY